MAGAPTLGSVAMALVLAVGAAPGTGPPVYPPPASQPAERPPSPFGPPGLEREDAIPGYVELSNGELAVGRIYTTRDKALRLYVRDLKRFLPIPLRSLKTIAGHLEWGREEPEWRWREMGSDDKLYSGRSYPVLKAYYTFTLLDGRAYTGDCQTQPLYVATRTETTRFILWQRHKGELGQTLADLRYIKAAHFGEQAMQRGLQMLEKDPARRARKQEGEPAPDRPPVLVGDPETKVVHRHTCRRAAKIPLPVGFLTLPEALAAGYSACPECRPEAQPVKPAATAPAPRGNPGRGAP
jgi:hypothetical protein